MRRPGNKAGETGDSRFFGLRPAPLRGAPAELWSLEVLAFPGGAEQVTGVGGGLLDLSEAGDRGSALGWVCLNNW